MFEAQAKPSVHMKTQVLVVMGSQTDAPVAKAAADVLDKFGVVHEDFICSAHRAPDELKQLIAEAESSHVFAIIAIAGWSAALPGAVSGYTHTIPVLGVVSPGRDMVDNLSAVLAIFNTPPGVPSSLCGIGEAGAINAALIAAAVVGQHHMDVQRALREYRKAESLKRGFGKPDYSKVPAKA